MTNINELAVKLREAAEELDGEAWHYARPSIYGRGYIINGAGQTVVCTSDGDVPAKCAGFIELASPANILALVEALENYKAAYEEEARDKAVQRSVIDDALCKLLPGCQYMDLPDGGNVTPLEQVARMVEDYRQRIASLEESHAQVIDARDHWKRCATEGLSKLAKARTLTVTLSDYRDTYKEAFASEVEHHVRIELGKLATAAGIKLQIERE